VRRDGGMVKSVTRYAICWTREYREQNGEKSEKEIGMEDEHSIQGTGAEGGGGV